MKWMLIIAMLVAGLIPLIVTGLYALNGAEEALTSKGFDQLKSLKTVKKSEIENYFHQIENQIISLSENHMTVDMMREAKDSYHNLRTDLNINENTLAEYKSDLRRFYENEFGKKFAEETDEDISLGGLLPASDAGIIVQYTYISNNKYPLGSKASLDESSDASAYSKVHSSYHPVLRNYLEKFGYYDIFLVDHQTGEIIYTVFKEIDYGTNLFTGAHKDSGIAEVVRKAANARTKGETFVNDFDWYVPSYNGAAAFIASPFLRTKK